MLHVKRGNYHKIIHSLHEKYGPVVRIAPNVLSLNFPGLIKVIYNTKDNYRKVSMKRSLPIIVVYLLTWNRLNSIMEAVPKQMGKSSTICSVNATPKTTPKKSNRLGNTTP